MRIKRESEQFRMLPLYI